MAVFKCKMCGGTLNIENGATVAECEFCGRKQTIPKLDDEKRANLYDRANHFRRTNDYDKAMGIYEIILNEDKTDAEAYWSILLCKYGVEYVEDPATHKRVPTINRTQFTSILKDVDYKNALKYADGYQRDIYEAEAKEIDKIQKGILAISGKEEPFDVFICYKETDHSGRRTIDSVLAQDLYHNLKNEGLKVFFSRITLEDKLGVAYEPYIFAALNSAKVMVVIGSKLEYFNAVWVKNEWSRFLSLIRNGEKKTLIPAYKDMAPYDLPDEFTHLQAQDMNKLGFMQDLVYGIKKIIGRTTPKTVVKETVVVDNHHDTAPLLRRAYLFLEDGDFDSANEYAEKVLDSNPECAEAYFIKLLAEVGIRKPELLLQSETVIAEYSNYKKALRFADKKFSEELNNYSETIQKNIEKARKQDIYEQACYAMQEGFFEDAISIFQGIIDYSDSASKIEECNELIDIRLKETIYNGVFARICNSAIVNDTILKQSIADLQSISGYKDSEQKIAELQARLEKYYHDKRVAEEQAKIRAEEERLRKLREAELRRIKIEKRKQKIKKTAKIGVPSILALTLVLVLTFTLFIPLGKYNKANDLLNSGNYEEAIKIYEDLGGFSGSEAKIVTINAVKTVENGSFEQGIKDALSAGAKVKVTYDFAGGAFVESQSGDGVSPMSFTLYKEETPEAEKTYTYTRTEDFSGLRTPERDGYYFQKWELVSCNAEVTSKDNTLNLRLIAIWSANKYTITYDLDGGSVSSTNPVGYNTDDDTFTLINPTRIGYTFIGWTGTDLEEKTMQVTIASGSYGNRSYTANWQANTYTITYNANGGTVSKTQDTATYDSEFVLATAERTGYTFLGWYVGNNEYKDFDCYNLINGLDLTAKWQINTYTITYNLNGGSAANEITYTVEDTITINAPIRTGYIFDGWTVAGLSDTSKLLTITKGTIGNKEFTANWTAKTYTVTYNANGGTVSKTQDVATYDAEFVLATAERRGYKFDGWKEDNKIYTSGDWKTDKSVILVAHWSIINYNITYNLDGGSAANVATYTVNDTITLNNPTRAGYTFIGWTYSGQTTPTKTVALSNEVGNKTFTANWQANLNTIIFNANGGVGEMQPQKIYTDSRENLTTNSFVYSGYTFMGWATSASGSVVYYDGANYKMGANSVYNLYAVWSKDTYNITYNLNNGTTSNPATYNVDTNTFTLNNPTRDGYEFIGWTGTGLNDYTNIVTIEKGSVGNRVYTANWQTTIVLHSNNGLNEQVSQRFVNTNTGNINANTFTNGDYIFNGWSTTVNGEVAYLDLASITLNQAYTDLYAVWGGTIGLTYLLNNDTYEVTGYNGTETDVLVADTYRGKTVASIGEQAFINKSGIESITIGTTITNIGSYAFDSVTARIIWNNPTIKEIGEYAFAGYDGTSIEVPSSVVKINSYAFYKCYNLTKIYYNAIEVNSASSNQGYAFAYAGESTEGITVYIDNNVKKIPACLFPEPYAGGSVNIKEVIFEEGSVCTYIGDYAFSGSRGRLSRINIPDTLETMGFAAFKSTSLTNITIPQLSDQLVGYYFGGTDGGYTNYLEGYASINKSVPSSLKSVKILGGTSINRYAFYNLSLDIIEIPNTLTSFNNEVYSVKTIKYAGDIEDWCSMSINGRGGSGIIDVYFNGTKVDNLVVPSTITEIPSSAFASFSIQSLTIPSTVKWIGDWAFNGCRSLTSVTILDGVTSIGERAFNDCRSLTSITIPNSVTSIGDYAFSDCLSLTNVFITDIAAWCKISFHDYSANPLNYAHNLYLNNELVTELIIPDGVTSIGSFAFSGCSSLTSITIPNSVKRISDSAFANCTSVTEILFNATNCADFASTNNVFASVGAKEVGVSLNIGKNVTRIPAYFAGGYSEPFYIKSILFEDESLCESIGTMAFYYCGITSLTIPETVTYIGNMAFACCNDLMEVNYYAENCVAAEPKALSGDGIFYGSGNNVKLTIGATVKNIENVFSIYGYSQYKLDIESVHYLGTVEQWCQINFNREPLTKNLHIGGELVENIAISGAVTKINDYAFCECTSLKSVVIESGVQEIGDYAFYGCANLESVDMADSIKTIGGHAFAQCKKLNDVNIPNGVEIIGADAFQSCESLTSIVIPNSVTEIGNAAFYGCKALETVVVGNGISILENQLFGYCINLNSIVIGSNVSEISSGVFEKCSQLTTIFTQNGLPSKIYNIDTDNVILKSATVYVFSAQTPNLNSDNTAYDGNYWHYVDGIPTIWVYIPEE